MKKIVTLVIGALLVICVTGSAIAFGDWKAGKVVYKTECTNCHKRNGDAFRLKIFEVPAIRWFSFCRADTTRKHVDILDKITVEQKQDMLQYLLKYAKEDPISRLH